MYGIDETPHVPGVHLEDAPGPLQPAHFEAIGELDHVEGLRGLALFGLRSSHRGP